MEKSFYKFLPKLFVFLIPFIILGGTYFIYDPFHVLRNYQHYGSNYLKTFNRNRISTQTYLNYKSEHQFNSFIFGSSRASAFLVEDWRKHLSNAPAFHFDAFNDNISGIRGKIEFIDKNGSDIKNALIIIDSDTFSEQYDESESIVHHKDHRWTDESALSYHTRFFKAYFKKKYFVSFLDLKIFDTYRPAYMDEFFKFKYYYTTPENDFLFPENIELIQKDSVAYYSDPEFYYRTGDATIFNRQIQEHHLEDLQKIADLFKQHQTDYKIVISPLFDQKPYNPLDLNILDIYFGRNNIYDFSGENKYTEDITNYYEISHFKPIVGKMIMDEIYNN